MPETSDRVESLFSAAAELPPKERAAFLKQECGADELLRKRLSELLKAHDRSNHPLDQPANQFEDLPTIQGGSSELVGTVIAGRYKLLEEIGEGGMGTVWVAEQTEPVTRKVALKLIKVGMDSRNVLARFEAERQALAMMDHPNIAKVLDGGLTDNGRPFFVMEYVKGVPITEYCDQVKLSVPERLDLFVQVCSAVQHAHQKGIIHRDLKPSNILVAPYDDTPVPKVIDFGLAKALHQRLTERTLHTAHETVIGTPLYMSPEQAQLNNLDVDTRSDIYSLGVLLYELLTGTTPLEKGRFKEAAWDEIRRIIREEEPPRPSTRLTSTGTLPSLAVSRQTEPIKLTQQLRGELDWIVMKALEKERIRRYETANGLARDIERYLTGDSVEACPPTLAYRLKKTYRKHRAAILTGAAFVALLVLGLSLTTHFAIKNKELARVAQDLAQESHLNATLAQENAKKEAEQRKLAEQQTAAAKAVTDFLFDDVLSAFDPAEQPDVDITLREVIDKASQRLKGAFQDVPQVEAAIKLSLGQAYQNLGEGYIAHELLRDVFNIRRELLGADDEETLIAHEMYVDTFPGSSWQTAIPLAESLLELQKAAKGESHPATLRAHRMLLEFQGRQLATSKDKTDSSKRWAKIEQELNLIREKQREIYGGDHDELLETNRVLAFAVYSPQHRFQERLELHRQSLEINRRLHGEVHPRTVGFMTGVCAALFDLERYDELEDQARKAIELKVALGYGNRSTLQSFLLLSYVQRGLIDQGIASYEEQVQQSRNDSSEFKLATLYAKYKDRATHERYCADLLSWHNDSQFPHRMAEAAEAYLMVPPHNPQLMTQAIELARRSTPPREETPFYHRFALNRGIVAYRAGDFEPAARWLSHPSIKGASIRGASIEGERITYPISRAYLAMTKFQLGDAKEAQTLLEESKKSISQLQPRYNTWSNVMRAQLVLEEAIALIEGNSSREESPLP